MTNLEKKQNTLICGNFNKNINKNKIIIVSTIIMLSIFFCGFIAGKKYEFNRINKQLIEDIEEAQLSFYIGVQDLPKELK